MNRYYLIIPTVLMVVFIFIERGATREAAAHKQAIIDAKAADDAKKVAERKALEEKARLDSEKRAEQRVAEDKAKDEKRKAEFAARIQKLKDEAKKFTDDIDLNTKLIATMEKELVGKRLAHEKENRSVLELAKKVEISKKDRRNAELEVQRFTEMLSARASESQMTKMPFVATSENPQK